MWLDAGKFALGLEAFGYDLIRGSAVEHALAAGVVGSVEPAPEWLEIPVRINE